jgi:hypothetical protein
MKSPERLPGLVKAVLAQQVFGTHLEGADCWQPATARQQGSKSIKNKFIQAGWQLARKPQAG